MRDRAEDQITLVFIRHGLTQANKERRYLGKTDEALSKEGMEILESYKRRKFYPDVEYLFTSPMKRCMETAGIIYPALRPVIIPEWREIDFGRFEYRSYEELKEDAEYQAWLCSGGILDFPAGESRREFTRRCKNGLIRVCNELSRAPGRNTGEPVSAGMIVHGGTIMSLLSLYGGYDYFDYQVPNGRGCICRLTGVHDRALREDRIQLKVAADI